MSAAACAPAWKAAWGIAPMGRGGRSGLPCSPTRPPAASTVSSVAGRATAGPVVPKGVTETWTICGKRSATPAVRPDSTNTSASARKAVGSGATTLRLPTPSAAQYRDSSPAKGGRVQALATAGRLDLDHLGAEFGEYPTGQFSPPRRGIDDTDVRKRSSDGASPRAGHSNASRGDRWPAGLLNPEAVLPRAMMFPHEATPRL